ncbi:hypothetical protein [Enterococcus camelliae]|uniref:Uncharacterized protein n=1 Tax=Enterococcus camelliae TaxID=453959 RepID=A0ABW5TF37_9ENTE
MIYTKDAVFPYPILSNTSTSYTENDFKLDVFIIDETKTTYTFRLSYFLSSYFLQNQVTLGNARYYLIIQSNDNLVVPLNGDQREITIQKSRLSLTSRTKIQLQILSERPINFAHAEELNSFYKKIRAQIELRKNTLLGYSNVVEFIGDDPKALDLFEQGINEDLPTDFTIKLNDECINLQFRTKELALDSLAINKNVKNMYLYIGLERALREFVNAYQNSNELVELDNMATIEKPLHEKLKSLMLNKYLHEISYDQVDDVIQKIAPDLIEKYTESIKELSKNGD